MRIQGHMVYHSTLRQQCRAKMIEVATTYTERMLRYAQDDYMLFALITIKILDVFRMLSVNLKIDLRCVKCGRMIIHGS